jgi:hypothetical protein
LRLLDESGFSLLAEAAFLFRNHKGTSMLEMPSIESDFPVLGGVDFNLLFCYESPGPKLLDFIRSKSYDIDYG